MATVPPALPRPESILEREPTPVRWREWTRRHQLVRTASNAQEWTEAHNTRLLTTLTAVSERDRVAEDNLYDSAISLRTSANGVHGSSIAARVSSRSVREHSVWTDDDFAHLNQTYVGSPDGSFVFLLRVPSATEWLEKEADHSDAWDSVARSVHSAILKPMLEEMEAYLPTASSTTPERVYTMGSDHRLAFDSFVDWMLAWAPRLERQLNRLYPSASTSYMLPHIVDTLRGHDYRSVGRASFTMTRRLMYNESTRPRVMDPYTNPSIRAPMVYNVDEVEVAGIPADQYNDLDDFKTKFGEIFPYIFYSMTEERYEQIRENARIYLGLLEGVPIDQTSTRDSRRVNAQFDALLEQIPTAIQNDFQRESNQNRGNVFYALRKQPELRDVFTASIIYNLIYESRADAETHNLDALHAPGSSIDRNYFGVPHSEPEVKLKLEEQWSERARSADNDQSVTTLDFARVNELTRRVRTIAAQEEVDEKIIMEVIRNQANVQRTDYRFLSKYGSVGRWLAHLLATEESGGKIVVAIARKYKLLSDDFHNLREITILVQSATWFYRYAKVLTYYPYLLRALQFALSVAVTEYAMASAFNLPRTMLNYVRLIYNATRLRIHRPPSVIEACGLCAKVLALQAEIADEDRQQSSSLQQQQVVHFAPRTYRLLETEFSPRGLSGFNGTIQNKKRPKWVVRMDTPAVRMLSSMDLVMMFDQTFDYYACPNFGFPSEQTRDQHPNATEQQQQRRRHTQPVSSIMEEEEDVRMIYSDPNPRDDIEIASFESPITPIRPRPNVHRRPRLLRGEFTQRPSVVDTPTRLRSVLPAEIRISTPSHTQRSTRSSNANSCYTVKRYS